jgi:3-hydroxymyristoyl/3-hydroxydecanoyl-(acyl carrier protein) dehydratase
MADPTQHFGAFSFVDRITQFAPGKGAHGLYHVPAAVRAFPACLVAEAVGQLAAWVSMEHIGYRGRPVAALAGETLFLDSVAPGDLIQLVVEIDHVDDDAVSYRGFADVNGKRVIELNDCLGPMLPAADFDDPEALRERFTLLCGEGARSIASRASSIRPWKPRNMFRDNRCARNCIFLCPPRFLPIIFRAGRCFRRRCCSIRRSEWPRNSRAKRILRRMRRRLLRRA